MSRRRVGAAIVVVLGLLTGLWFGVSWALASGPHAAGATTPAYTSATSGGLTAQPVLGFPATSATVIGASTDDQSNPGEVWAEGDVGAVPVTLGTGSSASQLSGQEVLVDRTTASGNWQVVPVQDGQGDQLATGWSTAEATPAGAVVLAGVTSASQSTTDPEQILVRQADQSAFAPASAPTSSEVPGDVTLSTAAPNTTPIVAADDEGSGVTGVFVAPTDETGSAAPAIYHYVAGGTSPGWDAELICGPQPSTSTPCPAPGPASITVDAISASSPSNAWMVATSGSGSGAVVQLYERTPESAAPSGYEWVQQPTSTIPQLQSGSGLQVPAAGTSPVTDAGAILTASGPGGSGGGGVWLDLESPGDAGSATLYYADGAVVGTWCTADLSCPTTDGTLPAELPGAGYGSIVTAPASSTSPGGRVITGLPHGAMMVLAPGAAANAAFAYQISIGGESESGVAPGATVSPDDGGGNTYGPGGETLAPGLMQPAATVPAVGGGAAFTSPTDAWIGIGGPTPGPEVAHLTNAPGGSSLTAWPTSATEPLLAIAGQPGVDAASGDGQAVAVGAQGEVERFTPGEGWSQEQLTGSGGTVMTPTLRAVAWPTAADAYAVGDGGAMWRWQAATSTWSPDPGAPASESADLTGIAFDPGDPTVGYAVGKGDTILSFGPGGAWQPAQQSGIPADADFSSVTFAGGEALAAYRVPGTTPETGGLAASVDGSAWSPVSGLPGGSPLLTNVAGLPGGGAVAAGPGIVIETDDAATGGWTYSPTPLGELSGGAVSALAAYTDANGDTEAIVSVDPDPTEDPSTGAAWQQADNPASPQPDPEPNQGFVVQQTPSGWDDTELQDFPGIDEPAQNGSGAATPAVDQPGWPDGVYALLVNATGTSGWGVGGQTGGTQALAPQSGSPSAAVKQTLAASQDGAAYRFGTGGPTPPVGAGPLWPAASLYDDSKASSQPVTMPTFAIGGGSGCSAPCADDAQQLLGGDQDLAQAISQAGQISGLRGFIDAGRAIGWSTGAASGVADGSAAYARELSQYADVLSGGPAGFPVWAVPNGTPSVGDIQSSSDEGLYQSALGGHDPVPQSVGPPPPPGSDAYAVDSQGVGGTVRMVVLDLSQSNGVPAQVSWLTRELAAAQSAGEASIVVGADNVTDPSTSNYAPDASAISQALIAGKALAYIYDAVDGQNELGQVGPQKTSTTLAVGVGTLGDGPPGGGYASDAGFLILTVDTHPPPSLGVDGASVATAIPSYGQVTLDAGQATVSARQTLVVGGLAHRVQGGAAGLGTREPSAQLPAVGSLEGESLCDQDYGCSTVPADAFTSSNPSVGEFVYQKSTDPTVPLPDPQDGNAIPSTTSDLFCAFAPGTTTVTLDAGGVTYSEPITVTQGSGSGPCPSTPPQIPGKASSSPGPTSTQPQPAPKPPAPKPKPKPVHHPAPRPVHHRPAPRPRPKPAPAPPPRVVHHHPAPVTPPAPAPAPAPAPPVAAPPPAPAPKSPPLSGVTPARPVPPTGITGARIPVGGVVPVSSPTLVPFNVVAVERRTSAEAAFEQSRQQFAAYQPAQHSVWVAPVALLVLALAGGGVGGAAVLARRRRGVAWAWLGRGRRWR